MYYSTNSVQRKLAEGSSAIYSATLKYGYDNFSIECCDISNLIEREQYYIDLLEPEYNTLKIAYSREGVKHIEIWLKSLGRKHTEEAKLKMREVAILRKGEETAFYFKYPSPESLLNLSINRSIKVKVIDTVLNEERLFLDAAECRIIHKI
uniref:GIY-YIG endonuclease n=1 Tax=Metarhizium rileyi (strain RCEF 4871) TaxID=1649241 RepID=A0A6H0B7C6_METRR|nr:GIY-YIG endonuclease [Metarhizium rileyi]QIS49083.1 GIY-YIG endonuclease [Metarhizium rileyi]